MRTDRKRASWRVLHKNRLSGKRTLIAFPASDVRAGLSLEPLEQRVMLSVQPLVDLNGALTGTGFTSSWTGSAVTIADAANATITDDTQVANLASLTVTLNSPATGDVLASVTTGTNITATFSGGTLSLTGSDSIANYQTVLRSVTYDNTAGGPTVNVETANVVANDGTVNGNTAVATINMPPPSF